MKFIKSNKIVLGCFCILTVINILIFFNRDHYQFTKQSSYYEIYPNYKDISLKCFRVVRDSNLSIELINTESTPIDWYIKDRKNGHIIIQKGVNPLLPLTEGVVNFSIKANKFIDSINLDVEYYSKHFFKIHGSTQEDRITVLRSVLPGDYQINNLKKWQNNKIDITEEDRIQLRKTLFDSIKINMTESSFVKAKKIAQYLCYKISSAKGEPNDSTIKLSVYQQYLGALNDKKINCGIYAGIFTLFASEAGITNRILEFKHRYGTFDDNIHVINEYFINEKNKWAAVDIMFNNIGYYDANGENLNAVEVKNANQSDNCISIQKSKLTSDSIISIPFSQIDNYFFYLYYKDRDVYYYYDTNLKNVYAANEKFYRYVSKRNWMEVYSDVSIFDNRPFYIKQLFLLLLILSFVFLIAFKLLKAVNLLK